MFFKHIRNATSIIEFGGVKFIIDPWLAPMGSYPPMGASLGRPDFGDPRPYPLSDLTETPENIMKQADVVIATHLHFDHFDEIAAKLIKEYNLPIFAQDEVDAEELRTKHGLTDISILSLEKPVLYKDVSIQRIEADHGDPEIYKVFPFRREASGFVLTSPKETKKVYFAGDTIYCKLLTDALEKYNPDIVVINGCHANTPLGPLLMDLPDIGRVHQNVPNAKLVIVHMDTVPHATVFSSDVKKYAVDNKLEEFIVVPANGETLTL